VVRFNNPFFCNVHLDANIVDHMADGLSPEITEVLELWSAGQLFLIIPNIVLKELLRNTTPPHVKAAAGRYIYTIPVNLTAGEVEDRRRFIEAARGNAEPKNIDPDLMHVWEAEKYGGGYFVTLDNRLLKRSSVIARTKQIEIVTPAELLDRVVEAKASDLARRNRFGRRPRAG
jgi:predicted nucleic acid-binding protein